MKIEELESVAAEPGFWNDRTRAEAITKQTKQLKSLVSAYDSQIRALSDAEVLLELADEAADEATGQEAVAAAKAVGKALDDLEFRRMLSGEFDGQGAIVQIQAGAGGVDASDWAQMLMRMIMRYAERKGWKVEVVDEQPAEEAGIKGATMIITGDNAFGLLKAENGVHRLVRVSPFDQQGRRQTSFASMTITPDIDDDIVVDINTEDLKIDTYRAGGAGGQHVNKTDSAVRITHLPTGIVVQCQNERSQHSNKAKAMKMLSARLYELEVSKREAKAAEEAKAKLKIEWGSQIRSYVLFPYQQVNDHRTEVKTSQVSAVLDGDLDDLIRTYLLQRAGAGA
ncbi:MAG: peptide chain release factor 2 [Kofleriaceae bacterium]|nr:peptide chain release factor 2 [Kofleriaceae bacterium]MBP9171062.1 peptide chain release factor 2 [Kofleriaceae bacterium]MBP9863016.1 peptide chain release factor 2 [Kofleriaceae bacterium]